MEKALARPSCWSENLRVLSQRPGAATFILRKALIVEVALRTPSACHVSLGLWKWMF